MSVTPLAVSVVIPAYQGRGFIGEALASVFAQTRPAREVVVVDDASTDDTASVVVSLARGAPVPVRLIRRAKNSGGPAHPLNVGVAAAEGPAIVTLDQDDQMTPDRIQGQVGLLERCETCPLVFGLCQRREADGSLSGPRIQAEDVLQTPHRPAGDGAYLLEPRSCYQRLVTVCNFVLGGSNIAFRKSAWQQLGGFCERYRIFWDLDFACRSCTLGGPGFVSRVVQHHRVHAGNLSGRELLWTRELLAFQAAQVARPLFDVDLASVRDEWGERYFHLGYHEAWAGNCRRALRAYGGSIRFGGPRLRALLAMLKALPLAACGPFLKTAS